MNQFRTVNDRVSVSPQISIADIDAAADLGVSLIINNRPDGEEIGQPSNEELSAYAIEKGIKWSYIPVIPGQVTMEAVASTSNVMRGGDKILAFCRSGTRSCNLWGLAQAFAGTIETDAIIKSAADAGYDLSSITPTLNQLRADAG